MTDQAMDHAAISLELLREDNAELEKRLEQMEEEKKAMLMKQEELERKSKLLGDQNQVLQKRLHATASNKEQVPPTPNREPSKELVQVKSQINSLDKEKAHIKTENDQLRKENEQLAKDVVNLRHDLERLYKRQKASSSAAPSSTIPSGDVDEEVAQLLDDQSTWKKKQQIISELFLQCASRMKDEHASKRRRLDESLSVQEQMVKDAIHQFQEELHAHQEFDRLEHHLLEAQSTDAAAATSQREDELRRWQNQCEQLQQDNQLERAKSESLQAALQNETRRVETASQELELLRKEVAQKGELATLLKQRTSDIRELETQREQLQERLAAKEQYLLAQKQDTLTVLKNKADERVQWETSEAKLLLQIQGLEHTVADLTAQLTASVASQTQSDQEQGAIVKEALLARGAAETARSDALAELRKEVDERKLLDQQLGATLAQRDALSSELLQVLAGRQDLQDQLARQSVQLEQLQQQLQEQTERNRASQERVDEVAARKDEKGPVTMPDLDHATSQELQSFFLAYYECAETKHRALLAERDALLGATQQLSQQRGHHHHASTAHSPPT